MNDISDPKDRIIIPLDFPSAEQAEETAKALRPYIGAVKVGLELVNVAGPAILDRLVAAGLRVFYDAKLHDIPNTVAGAVRAAAGRGLWMLNVHATGGSAMMRAAVEAARATTDSPPLMIAVTLLTSLDSGTLRSELKVGVSAEEYVVSLARMAQESGMDGVVASPLEAAAVRAACGPEFAIVTPGVRPSWAAANDQRRMATPLTAVDNGADYLVIGRPITAAPDPISAARQVAVELR